MDRIVGLKVFSGCPVSLVIFDLLLCTRVGFVIGFHVRYSWLFHVVYDLLENWIDLFLNSREVYLDGYDPELDGDLPILDPDYAPVNPDFAKLPRQGELPQVQQAPPANLPHPEPAPSLPEFPDQPAFEP